MIDIVNIEKSFKENKVLKNVSINIQKGDIFGIVGHSGAGKSTILRCINGLEDYDKGNIFVEKREVNTLKGKELRCFRKDLGMIFQNFNLLNRKNIFENVAMPLRTWGYDRVYINNRVRELLELVGLENKEKCMPKELSGGQKQRVAIARALALNPKILLCDEATSALDPKTTKSILRLLKKINKDLDITIVMVTHQMEVVKEICNKVALMDLGEIKACGKVEELFLKPDNNLRILLDEGRIVPDNGKNITIYFPKNISEKCLITSMARELDIDFSIVWGRLERFRDSVLGSLVINIKQKHKEKVIKYLNSKSIIWEEE